MTENSGSRFREGKWVFEGASVADLAALALLTAIALAFAWPGFSVGWSIGDEMNTALVAHKYSPADYFFDPRIYRLHNHAALTPWAIFSYELDLQIASFWLGERDPQAWVTRLHQGLSGALLLGVTYFFLRGWLLPSLALVTTAIFSLSWPAVDAYTATTSRHYVEGGIFAVLSLMAYFHAGRMPGGSVVALRVLSAFLFLLALTAKEIFAPLPVFLFLIERGGLGERMRKLWAHGVVVVFYIAWRYLMLGVLVGGYETPGRGLVPSMLFFEAFRLLEELPGGLYAWKPAGAVFLAACLGVAGMGLLRRRWKLRHALALAICLIGPILPLVSLIEGFGPRTIGRYFLVFSWSLSVVMGLSLAVKFRPKTAIALGSAVLLVTVASVPATQEALQSRFDWLRHRSDSCGRFFWNAGPSAVFVVQGDVFLKYFFTLMGHFKRDLDPDRAPQVVTVPSLFPEDLETGLLFVAGDGPRPCYRSGTRARRELAAARSLNRVDPEWTPGITWEDDGFVMDPAPTPPGAMVLHLLRGPDNAARVGIATPRVGQLRQKIWMHDIGQPAQLILATVAPNGGRTFSQPVDVPARFWDVQR